MSPARIGVDLGGTKIAAILLGPDGREVAARRIAAPRGDYGATIAAIRDLVSEIEAEFAVPARVGVGMPGSISPSTGRVQNANSTWLNGQPFDRDLSQALGREVRVANDANCLALSEATDGAGAGAHSVFGVILGTGCGGGIVVGGRILNGPRSIGGEWGHNPLPWAEANEYPGPLCWCGRRGCMEVWVSGSGLSRAHAESTGAHLSVETIARLAGTGDAVARVSLTEHTSRLARGLAQVVNVIDPEVIVLGGGLSGLTHLYDDLPPLIARHMLSDGGTVSVKPARWGDASGVRGAAWLWD